jgi:hypothetical protein
VPKQAPALHLSPVVQALPSLQALPVRATLRQPEDTLQLSWVHGLSSSQSTAMPGWQAPLALQVSPVVQALLSLHSVPVRARLTQPLVALQLSAVQALPSSQLTVVPTQLAAALQTSPLVQAEPSEQAVPVKATFLQPVAVSQLSCVQGLLSLQLAVAPGAQNPLALQRSGPVQALPSLHGSPVRAVFLQPLVVSQLSTVQVLPSSQLTVVPTQLLAALQTSPLVQALPSEQAVPVRATFLQPVAVSQLSCEQGLLSLQSAVAPGTQAPLLLQVSPTVHALLSVQLLPVLALLTQPPASVQVSVVQGLPSSQFCVVPKQAPALHLSPVVHALPSLQAVPVKATF